MGSPTSKLHTLLSYVEPAITGSLPHIPNDLWQGSAPLFQQLLALLKHRNGFFAFEKALHLFPAPSASQRLEGYDIIDWNRPGLWKNAFPEEVQNLFCFAEDIFGCQWALQQDHICKFNPETCEIVRFADDFETWAERILQDARAETGWPLSQQWIRLHGDLPATCRLIPKTLFIFGGKFTVDNLFAVDAVEGMRFRGDIARQIRDLPDGTKIKIILD